MLYLFYILFFIFSGISHGINEQLSSKFTKHSESLEKLEECLCSDSFDIFIEQGKYGHVEAPHNLNCTQSQNKTTECGNILFNEPYINGSKLLFVVVENSSDYKLLTASYSNTTTLVPISCVNKNIVIFERTSRNSNTSQQHDGGICGSVAWEIQQVVSRQWYLKRCILKGFFYLK